MTVEFVCQKCDKDNLVKLQPEMAATTCRHCGESIELKQSTSVKRGGKIDRCVLCDNIRFYVQKDFNPRLGILIFVIGVLFSYHTYFLSLVIATLIDFILYKTLGTVTICYNCRAVYRGFEEDPSHRGYDHNIVLNMVEKEEREQAEKSPGKMQEAGSL